MTMPDPSAEEPTAEEPSAEEPSAGEPTAEEPRAPEPAAPASAEHESPRPSLATRLAPVLDRWLVVFAVGCVLVAVIRLVPVQTPLPFSAIEAEARWAALLALVGLAVSGARRSKRTAGAYALATAVLVPWSLEWAPSMIGHDPSARANLSVLSTNVLAPNPSRALAQEILRSDADVVLVQEASDEWWSLLEEEGVLARYPHHVEETHSYRQDYMGIAILSRLPIVEAEVENLASTYVPLARADVVLANGARVRLYSVHTLPPYVGELLERHLAQMARLRELARADMNDPALDAVVFGGDFNASPMSFQYRQLREVGLVPAHDRVGRGFATTWPNLPWPFPPMRLDHAFVAGSDVEVVSVREGEGEGSDHLPVRVDLAIGPRAR